MFGVIGETIGKMFGTDKAVKSVVDHTAGALDKLIYTDEEKAEDKAASRTEARKMVINWMAATSGQNLARRLIALTVTLIWGIQYLAVVGLSVAAVWVDNSLKLTESAEVIGDYAVKTNAAFLLILGFYFAAPHMGNVAHKALDRFSQQKSSK